MGNSVKPSEDKLYTKMSKGTIFRILSVIFTS